jgi:hypothetical protein
MKTWTEDEAVTVARLRDHIKPWAVVYFAPDGRVMNHAADYFWTRRGAERRARHHREDYDRAWTCKVVRNA